ncbi:MULTISPECIES: nucleotidyltransferase domain-containing protein [Sulfurimonas]|uniref:nucleotidyltransferase domain-containing protein n=1 Tax=Sulfurimonas TaxID=202746 RepID=UPI00165F56BB|nr:nucleotidyltransferase domain-containing protein [Sulfurimonas indica]
MRLSEKVKQKITQTVHRIFGDVDIYLFGSRVDDTKRGGDIDIALDMSLSKDEFRKKKTKFFTALMQMDFFYDVDLVLMGTTDKLLRDEIRKNSIKL